MVSERCPRGSNSVIEVLDGVREVSKRCRVA